MFVTNFLPAQRLISIMWPALYPVIEMDGFTKVKDIQLANGSNALRGICITPDSNIYICIAQLGAFCRPYIFNCSRDG